MAGLMIIPAVFAFSGGNPDTLQAGPALMFITIPKVFENMGLGTAIGILFFLLVLFAALTSSIALTESAVSTFEDEIGWSRKKSTVLVGVIMIVLGSLSSLGYGPLAFVKIIGMQFLDFFDFLTNTGVFVLISLVIMIVYFYLAFRKELKQNEGGVDTSTIPSPSEAITDKSGFIFSCVIFLLSVVLLLTQTQTGLTVAAIGVIIAIITLICSGRHGLELLKKIDYKTLLFFIGLFVVVGGLEQTGILELAAGFIGKVSHGNAKVMIAIIIWVSAIASAFVDNIPFAATMIPVIKTLAASTGVDLSVLAWTLAMGTDIGGSATPIGASANVVGMSIAANKFDGIRAACCSDTFSARFTRLHNDANVLCMGARVVGSGLAVDMVDLFLDTEFENSGNHPRRVALLAEIEKTHR